MYFFISNNHQHNNKEQLIKMIQQCKYDFLHKLKPIDDKKDKFSL
jgi:hypothetical protein